MKHEISVPRSDKIHPLVAKEVLRLCGCKEYTASGYDFPVVLGKDEKGAPVVADLPALGNLLLLGPTGGSSLYEMVLLAQMLWARYTKPLDVAVFDYPVGMLEGVCAGHGQYSFGAESELGAFLRNLRTVIEKRKAGGEDTQTHKVFFVHIFSERPKSLDREVLGGILKEDLRRLGMQLVVCGETSAATSRLKQDTDLFDTAIELERGDNGNRLYGAIGTGWRCPKNSFAGRFVYSADLASE